MFQLKELQTLLWLQLCLSKTKESHKIHPLDTSQSRRIDPLLGGGSLDRREEGSASAGRFYVVVLFVVVNFLDCERPPAFIFIFL